MLSLFIPLMESTSEKGCPPLQRSNKVSQVAVMRPVMFIILPVMTRIIALGRLPTSIFKSSKQYKHYKQQKYNPPTYSRVCSKWKPLRNVIIWLAIFCEPTLRWKSMANGYPLVTETNEMTLPSTSNFVSSGIEHQVDDYYNQDGVTDPQAFEDIIEEPVELTTSFNSYDFRPPQSEHKFGIRIIRNANSKKPEKARYARASNMMVHPRRKKGLSFLSKYYSQAVLNNNTNSNSVFGINVGTSSGEQRFPSVRRKLSLYPPLTLMNPWSRTGSRSASMRLRWGK
ncbi:unnamed protein product [Orchesella dallaii]|uniref:Uncharacterized protein n=1 Tax=Orchesella dallaii TaxID=48710 RepID=A0ABP1PUU1_9HEXA